MFLSSSDSRRRNVYRVNECSNGGGRSGKPLFASVRARRKGSGSLLALSSCSSSQSNSELDSISSASSHGFGVRSRSLRNLVSASKNPLSVFVSRGAAKRFVGASDAHCTRETPVLLRRLTRKGTIYPMRTSVSTLDLTLAGQQNLRVMPVQVGTCGTVVLF